MDDLKRPTGSKLLECTLMCCSGFVLVVLVPEESVYEKGLKHSMKLGKQKDMFDPVDHADLIISELDFEIKKKKKETTTHSLYLCNSKPITGANVESGKYKNVLLFDTDTTNTPQTNHFVLLRGAYGTKNTWSCILVDHKSTLKLCVQRCTKVTLKPKAFQSTLLTTQQCQITILSFFVGLINVVLPFSKVIHAHGSLTCPSGQYFLAIQEDGKCLLYSAAKPDAAHTFWAVDSNRGAAMTVNNVGEFIVMDKNEKPVFKSPGGPFPLDEGYKLVLENDGNMVLYSSKDVPVWNSESAKRFMEVLA
ncbi:hypothetical protein SELMODRAFT_417224 [Selaginella moellendorffii]|uniref:Bulb-type lectin domain-containing protein n=1 Tax=Selaginella moellendorffii TaxID=88036 RepID=D8S1S4_SELML|nr:hypothetical protein SELMODRAFT_417224 [Selaginella moellendorffii]